MKTNTLIALGCLFFLCSCEEVNVVPSPSIFRNWEEYESLDIPQFEGSTITSLRLNPDSTYQLTYVAWTDVRIPDDPCQRVTDYFAKGKFVMHGDSIFFRGCASDSTCTNCVMRCDGVMDYVEACNFKLSEDTLLINPNMDVTHRRILLKKRI